MARTTYGDISQRTAYHAMATMLAHAQPVIVLGKLGQSRPIPGNTANQAKFRRPVVFDVSTTPLVEGVTPTAHKMRFEDVPVVLNQYGDLVEISDVIADTGEDPVLQEAAMLSGENAAETTEMICWGVVKAGTNKFYANGVARADVNTPVSVNKQHAVIRSLRNNRAKPITRILNGSTNINTTPIEGGYVWVAHTDAEHDIRNMTGFVPVAEYGSRQPICPEELGSVENSRFILSPLLLPYLNAGSSTINGMKSTDGVNTDVYPMVCFGQEAFGHVPLAGKDRITPTVINPGTIDKSDPLGQRGYVGWKTYYAAVRLNESWMAVLETCVTDL